MIERRRIVLLVACCWMGICAPVRGDDGPEARWRCPYTQDGACIPNTRSYGYYPTRWRKWPSGKPGAATKETIPTPAPAKSGDEKQSPPADEEELPTNEDHTPADRGPKSESAPDTGATESIPPDMAAPDTGPTDAAPPDAAPPDTAPPDAAPPDAAPQNAAPGAAPPNAAPPAGAPPQAAPRGKTPPPATAPRSKAGATTQPKTLEPELPAELNRNLPQPPNMEKLLPDEGSDEAPLPPELNEPGSIPAEEDPFRDDPLPGEDAKKSGARRKPASAAQAQAIRWRRNPRLQRPTAAGKVDDQVVLANAQGSAAPQRDATTVQPSPFKPAVSRSNPLRSIPQSDLLPAPMGDEEVVPAAEWSSETGGVTATPAVWHANPLRSGR